MGLIGGGILGIKVFNDPSILGLISRLNAERSIADASSVTEASSTIVADSITEASAITDSASEAPNAKRPLVFEFLEKSVQRCKATHPEQFEWQLLVEKFEAAAEQWEALYSTAGQGWVKSYLLTPAEKQAAKALVVETGASLLETLEAVENVAQNGRTSEGAGRLATACSKLSNTIEPIKGLAEQVHATPVLNTWIKITGVLMAVVSVLWGIFLKVGILAAAAISTWAVPFVLGSAALLLSQVKEMQVFVAEIKVQDQKALADLYESLISNLKGFEDKMSLANLIDINQRLSGLDEVLALLKAKDNGVNTSNPVNGETSTQHAVEDSLDAAVKSLLQQGKSRKDILQALQQKIEELEAQAPQTSPSNDISSASSSNLKKTV